MSFGIGLSGLNAAKQDLEAISNNIANSNTVGFKGSRTEFADLYASSVGGGSSKGTGVQVASTSQQFSQGNLTYTENALDMAISGNGYFVVDNNGQQAFTRAGYFSLNADNEVINNQGLNLQGFAADANGNILPGTLADLKINANEIPATATSAVEGAANLDSRVDNLSGTAFDAVNPDTYNSTMAFNVFDSQGNPHTLSLYFANQGGNVWHSYMQVDGKAIQNDLGDPAYLELQFSESGQFTSAALGTDYTGPTVDGVGVVNGIVIPGADLAGSSGALVNDLDFSLDLTSFSQLGAEFSVNRAVQNGFPPGQLTGLEVSDEGILRALYSNGQSSVQGQVVLAAFPNDNGLIPAGDSLWNASFASGTPLYGAAGSGTLGGLQSAALEQSNVDLSLELVRLIEAQRNYQANAKTIETSSNLTQTLMQII